MTFWGPAWTGDTEHQNRRANLRQFVGDLLQSDYVNILTQYGVGEGAGHCGRLVGDFDVASVTGQLDEAGIHRAIQAMIDAGTVSEPTSPSQTALVVFLDEGIEVKDAGAKVVMCEPHGDNAFGYHSSYKTTAGHQLYFAVVPSLADACLKETCPGGDAHCSLQLGQAQEDRQTQVASHEICEMLTDPEGNAWFDGKSGDENGDVCNGEGGTITVNGRMWNVQRMYSVANDRQGRPACIVGAPAPIPAPTHP